MHKVGNFQVSIIPHINSANLCEIIKEFHGAYEIKIDNAGIVKFFVDETLSDEKVRKLEKIHSCDIFQLPLDILKLFWDPSISKVAVFDLDSTLIQMEVIDTLAASKPEIGEKVARITEEAMAGRIDFKESLERRVALLEGIDIGKQWEKIKETVKFTAGAEHLFKNLFCKENGWTTAVISGGFLPIADWVRSKLNLTFAYANQLEIDPQTGLLTGKLFPNHPLIDSHAKADHITKLIQKYRAKVSVAVGDGANDLLMLGKATIGIAFKAKPIVQEKAMFRLNSANIYSLYNVLKLEE